MRPDGRLADQLRAVTIERGYTRFAEGSVLITMGNTRVVCTATVENRVPLFLRDTGEGWITAEYAMLPRSAPERVPREAAKKGRALEISRLIGRSLRAVVDRSLLGERQITLDCDVIQADGGTRTAAITGAYVALRDAIERLVAEGAVAAVPVRAQCAGVSVGVVAGEARLDLCYEEDVAAEVDMNVVMDSAGGLVELQGCAEKEPFSRAELGRLLDLAEKGVHELFALQEEALSQ